MNIYILTYKGGASGMFINYFINRHKSFPNPIRIGTPIKGDRSSLSDDSSVHFTMFGKQQITDVLYVRDHYTDMTDHLYREDGEMSDMNHPGVSWYGCDSYKLNQITGCYFNKSVNDDMFDNYHNTIDEWFKNVKDSYLNPDFDSISFTPSPSHAPSFFVHHPNYIVGTGGDYNYKHITVLVDSTFKRIAASTSKPETLDTHYYHNVEVMSKCSPVPIHVIDLLKLIECDTNEYNKLLDFIEQPPLDNWKELITDYRTAINY
jgi:hypothetical protein